MKGFYFGLIEFVNLKFLPLWSATIPCIHSITLQFVNYYPHKYSSRNLFTNQPNQPLHCTPHNFFNDTIRYEVLLRSYKLSCL